MTEVKQLPLCIGLTTLFCGVEVRAEDLITEQQISQLETQVVQLKQQIMDLSVQQQKMQLSFSHILHLLPRLLHLHQKPLVLNLVGSPWLMVKRN